MLLPEEQLTLERNTLATQGVAVATIQARESVPASDKLAGLTVNFGTGGDLAGSCANQGLDSFYCPGTGFLSYRVEAVDRVGNDSFAPGHGILISKSQEQRHAERVADRPEPAGHRDDRLLPAGRNAGRGRPR